MENTQWVVDQLAKRYSFKGYEINCREVVDEETTVEYYYTNFGETELELKVTLTGAGHWTEFEVEKREVGNEDWNYFDSFEKWIA